MLPFRRSAGCQRQPTQGCLFPIDEEQAEGVEKGFRGSPLNAPLRL